MVVCPPCREPNLKYVSSAKEAAALKKHGPEMISPQPRQADVLGAQSRFYATAGRTIAVSRQNSSDYR